jgi:hypothetical protein
LQSRGLLLASLVDQLVQLLSLQAACNRKELLVKLFLVFELAQILYTDIN